MNAKIKSEIEQHLLDKISEAVCNFDTNKEERYKKAYDEFCENILEE